MSFIDSGIRFTALYGVLLLLTLTVSCLMLIWLSLNPILGLLLGMASSLTSHVVGWLEVVELNVASKEELLKFKWIGCWFSLQLGVVLPTWRNWKYTASYVERLSDLAWRAMHMEPEAIELKDFRRNQLSLLQISAITLSSSWHLLFFQVDCNTTLALLHLLVYCSHRWHWGLLTKVQIAATD